MPRGIEDQTKLGAEVTRFIGIPTSVSKQAQEFLNMGALFRSAGDEGSAGPRDADGWRAMIAAVDEGIIATLNPRVQGFGFVVESREVNHVPVFTIEAQETVGQPDQLMYLDIHGGGLINGGGEACRALAQMSAAQVGIPTWSVDYRMPPDHPYPSALDDCVAVYRHLVETRPPQSIVVGGSSAGGNLAAALMLRVRDEGLPLPAALVLLTPEVDLTESGDTFQTNLGVDTVLTESLAESIALYAGSHDLRDPYLSPLFGDFTAPFPPTFLQSGTRDLFLSNTVRMHRRLRAAGVDAELHVFEAMPHGGFFGAPEDEELTVELRRFLDSRVRV